VINWGYLYSGPLYELDSFFRTACGTHPATNAAIQFHLWYLILSHCKDFHGTPVNTGLTGNAKLRVLDRLKTGVKGYARLGLGKGCLKDYTMTGAVVTQELDLLPIQGGMNKPCLL